MRSVSSSFFSGEEYHFVQVMDSYSQKSQELFHKGYNCAQSVFASFATPVGMTEELALRLSSPFGAGLGRMRGVCGAFAGVTLLNGYLHGNITPDSDAKEKIYERVQRMAEEFKARFGSLECRDLLGLATDKKESARPAERTAAYYAARPCEECVRFCTEMGVRLLEESEASRA